MNGRVSFEEPSNNPSLSGNHYKQAGAACGILEFYQAPSLAIACRSVRKVGPYLVACTAERSPLAGTMGNLICIAGPRKSDKKGEVNLNRQISPIPSLRHLKPKPAKQDTLQDICVGVVAENVWSLNAQILPPELIQRVVDVLCDSGT